MDAQKELEKWKADFSVARNSTLNKSHSVRQLP